MNLLSKLIKPQIDTNELIEAERMANIAAVSLVIPNWGDMLAAATEKAALLTQEAEALNAEGEDLAMQASKKFGESDVKDDAAKAIESAVARLTA